MILVNQDDAKTMTPRCAYPYDRYMKALQQAGRRITEQRKLICEYLAATRSHPTPYQVYTDLSAAHPEISRATVYNTLNVLKELGAIVEIGNGTEHTQYDTDTTPHVNLICLRCHSVTDVHPSKPINEIAAQAAAVDDFLPMTARMDVFGFCQECRTRKQAEIREQWLRQQQPHKQEGIV